jgi:hypothetical protein
MVEEPISLHRAAMARDMSPGTVPQITFNRLLTVYGRMVAAG